MTRNLSIAALSLVLGAGPFASAADTARGQPAASRSTLVFNKPAGSTALSSSSPEPRQPILGKPYVTSGFIKKELPTTATGQPYVTEGYVRIETDARGKSVIPQGTPAQPKPQAALVKRIQDACGKSAREVEVTPESPTSLRVRFTVRNFADAERVSKQILKLPDLLPYQVSFEVQLQQ